MAHESYPLFSHEEVEFLAPLIVTALAQAQPDQQVRFTMQDDGLTTQGALYVYKTTLRVILSRYRSTTRMDKPDPRRSGSPSRPPKPWYQATPRNPG
jgi:hypothetical protein